MMNRTSNRRIGSIFIVLAAMFTQMVAAAVLDVPGTYTTIQAAIDAATNGDSVVVAAGNYVENLNLKSGVNVRGAETARTFIQPETPASPVILASGVDNVRLANFIIINAQTGFDSINSTNLQLANTVFVGAGHIALQVDADSQIDVLNVVFMNNSVAVRRATALVQIINSGFIGNTVTITSPVAPFIASSTNVNNCGFYSNEDLRVSGIDTGLGVAAVIGNPGFVATADFDYHLQQSSPFINTGLGIDVIDNSVADIGAYGGQYADVKPFPVAAPLVTNVSGDPSPPYSVSVEWSANQAYLVTNSVTSGRYLVYYRQNQSGPPYDGTDVGNGTQPSPIDRGAITKLTLDNLQPSVPPPAAPQLLSAEPLMSSAMISWEAVAGAVDYRVYYGTAAVTENQVDVGDVTTFTVSDLENATEYRFAVSAFVQPVYHFSVTALDSTPSANESEFSPESTLVIGSLTEGVLSNQLTATPDDTASYPDLSDSGCFVATAAFGVDWSAEVQVLRDFRDRFLLSNGPGRAFVRWYYRNGPSAAALMVEFDAVRPAVRAFLWPFVVIALFALAASPAASFAVLFLCLALVIVRHGALNRHFFMRLTE
ncbi:MAG: hypothetical protein CL798_04130 [Chromatiales bacterium]|jgi:hypothetical protein|nr:hypothetical protein [Chromatiales bacterium]